MIDSRSRLLIGRAGVWVSAQDGSGGDMLSIFMCIHYWRLICDQQHQEDPVQLTHITRTPVPVPWQRRLCCSAARRAAWRSGGVLQNEVGPPEGPIISLQSCRRASCRELIPVQFIPFGSGRRAQRALLNLETNNLIKGLRGRRHKLVPPPVTSFLQDADRFLASFMTSAV